MTQNTLSDEIERELEHFNKFYGAMFECGDFDALYADIKHSLRSIAEKTIEAVRVKEDDMEWDCNDNCSHDVHMKAQGRNKAITEQSKLADQWLGKDK